MENPTPQQEIRIGIAGACALMPKDDALVRDAIALVEQRFEQEREAVKEAKEFSGFKDAVETVVQVYGIHKDVLAFLRKLWKKEPGDRAAMLAQTAKIAQALGYLDKDLVSLAEEASHTAGSGADGQGSIFDSTDAAQRQGIDGAEPVTVKAKASPPVGTPTPGVSLEVAERLFKEAQDKFASKRGRKPIEYLNAEATFKAALEADSAPAPRGRPVLVDDDFDTAAPAKNEGPFSGKAGSGSYTLAG